MLGLCFGNITLSLGRETSVAEGSRVEEKLGASKIAVRGLLLEG